MKKIINFLKRFNWQQAKKVHAETIANLLLMIYCYSFTITSIIALFYGIWWQLFFGALMFLFGTICLNDPFRDHESVLDYLHRVFTK
ncbi:MAG: hypothetical protein KBS95_06240 [Alistipes sp.]|nr:hypothetical protein [Candidatus Alistipes equi]